MNLNFKDWRRTLKVWAPPLIGIPVMLLLGYWFAVARFFLFMHHLFWIIGIILLINPVSESFWPSRTEMEKKTWAPPQPSTKARARREARKHMEKRKPASPSETPAERLARLQRQKEAVDQKIEKLADKDKERVK